jgi:RHS repeat-associated protein
MGATNPATYESESVVEALDYYPFGGMRVDTKTNYGGVRNKYAGTVYDALSGLNYMQARYQNSARGQFISEDPVFLGDPSQQNLKDPQSLNSYSYASDNPIVKTDPAGLITYIIPGTHYASQDWTNSGSESGFISSVGKTFNETPVVMNDYSIWSGADNSRARTDAAERIAQDISNHQFATNEQLNIVGLSHGGNVAIEVSRLTKHKIDTLVTLGTPSRADYEPNAAMINQHLSAYSQRDPVQTSGGGQFSISQIVGGFFGPIGGAVGSYLHWGEFGPAGRTFPDATNINATSNQRGIAAHGALWRTNSAAWSQINATMNH